MEPFREKGYSMALWSTFIFKSVCVKYDFIVKKNNLLTLGIVQPKMNICWKFTHSLASQDADFVSSS